MQIISSKDNEQIKYIRKLKDKKFRDETNEYLVEGIKLVREAIEEKREEPDRTGRIFSLGKRKNHGGIPGKSRLWPGGIYSGLKGVLFLPFFLWDWES